MSLRERRELLEPAPGRLVEEVRHAAEYARGREGGRRRGNARSPRGGALARQGAASRTSLAAGGRAVSRPQQLRRRSRVPAVRGRHALAGCRVGRGVVAALLELVAARRLDAPPSRRRAQRRVPPRVRPAVRVVPRGRAGARAAALPDDPRQAPLIELREPAGAFAAPPAGLPPQGVL